MDQLIQDSLQLKSKLNYEIQQNKKAHRETKNNKLSIRKSNIGNVATVDSLESPLRFLRQNKNLSNYCQTYLRKLNLALLEILVVKEKMVKNTIKQNKALVSRIFELTGEEIEVPSVGLEFIPVKQNNPVV